MNYICPKCGRAAEYNAYYGKVMCTSCDWQESRKICNHKNGSISSILGIPVDPCIYKNIESYRNVTVIISRCVNCGNIDISWKKQDNTEKIDILDEGSII